MKNATSDDGIYVFRIPVEENQKLLAKYDQTPVVGIKSKHQFARKIILDFLEGRLIYLNPSAISDNTLIKQG